jgi:hypothetical protein
VNHEQRSKELPMNIWRGKGIVVAFIAFGCLILTELATRSMYGDKTYYQSHGWPKLAGFWVAAALVYMLQPWFGGRQERTLVDKETGKEITVSFQSALFLIPVRYWPLILLGLGVVFLFVRE